jgi:hypothetical protein
MEKQRVNLMVDTEVVEMLDEMAGSERKRGQYISQLVRNAYAAQRHNTELRTMDVEALRLTVIGLAGRVAAVEGQLVQVQSQVARLIENRRLVK